MYKLLRAERFNMLDYFIHAGLILHLALSHSFFFNTHPTCKLELLRVLTHFAQGVCERIYIPRWNVENNFVTILRALQHRVVDRKSSTFAL